jgi:hypothetical protein
MAEATSDNWFRSAAWDRAARKEFETHLAGTRSSRAQFIRVKGLALVQSGARKRVIAGRKLLVRILDQHPDNVPEVARAHRILGESYLHDGRLGDAERHLRAGLEAEKGRSFQHDTELRLAEVIVERKGAEAFGEAWQLLNQAAQKGFVFNGYPWRVEVARARLRDLEGDRPGAATHAAAALELLENNSPQLPGHDDVGRIKADAMTVAEMSRLAEESGPATPRNGPEPQNH